MNKKVLLSAMALLVFSMIAPVMVNPIGASELKLKVRWNPVSYQLGSQVPDPWNAELCFAPPRNFLEIDIFTLLLDGRYTFTSTPYPSTKKLRLVVPFDGNEVMTVVMSKVGPLSSGHRYRVQLEITGFLYDGTPFRGEGGLFLEVP